MDKLSNYDNTVRMNTELETKLKTVEIEKNRLNSEIIKVVFDEPCKHVDKMRVNSLLFLITKDAFQISNKLRASQTILGPRGKIFSWFPFKDKGTRF